jgi:CTP:molybdopterin cytidylyltransferase MocA
VTAVVVLAAGEGRRFGGAKQLHPIRGRPMLEHVMKAVATSGIDLRVVVLGARADTILERVDLHGATPIVIANWRQGQATSLRAGLAALPERVTKAVVVLGDGPNLSPQAMTRVLAAGDGARAADYGNGRSHPVVLPRLVWPALPEIGETPGRALDVLLVDCRDLPPPGDVDLPPAAA